MSFNIKFTLSRKYNLTNHQQIIAPNFSFCFLISSTIVINITLMNIIKNFTTQNRHVRKAEYIFSRFYFLYCIGMVYIHDIRVVLSKHYIKQKKKLFIYYYPFLSLKCVSVSALSFCPFVRSFGLTKISTMYCYYGPIFFFWQSFITYTCIHKIQTNGNRENKITHALANANREIKYSNFNVEIMSGAYCVCIAL